MERTSIHIPTMLSERIDRLKPYQSMAKHELLSEALDAWEEEAEGGTP